MIVDLMHACDVTESLAADPPTAATDWQWSKQLRYYQDAAPTTTQNKASPAPDRLRRLPASCVLQTCPTVISSAGSCHI